VSTPQEQAELALANGEPVCFTNREELSACWIGDVLAGRTGPQTRHPKGLTIEGGCLTGSADWSHDRFTVRFALVDCEFVEPVCASGLRVDGDAAFQGCTVRGLDLSDARIDGDLDLSKLTVLERDTEELRPILDLNSVNVAGSLHLRSASVHGETSLLAAVIGGSLECTGAILSNPGGQSLTADGANIRNSVFLDQEFNAVGEVRLIEAVIGGQLVCRKSRFTNLEGDALSAHSAKVTGNVFLDNGFEAGGAVQLFQAQIGGQLVCRRATLTNPDGDALSVHSAKINGNLVLDEGFDATGLVRLCQTNIHGGLDCRGARFKGSPKAFDAEEMSVSGRFQFGPTDRPTGMVNLRKAQVGQLCDEMEGWPAPSPGSNLGVLNLTGFTYGQFGEGAVTDVRRRLEWIRTQTRTDYTPQPYLQLAAVYEQEGMDYEQRQVLIAKQDDLRKYGQLK